MTGDGQVLAKLQAKDEIRELVLLYSRGVDRKDIGLLRTLYTADGTDDHAGVYTGDAKGYVDFLEKSLPNTFRAAHTVCNHLISVDGDTGEGDVYCIAWHLYPDGKGGLTEDVGLVRYVDRYRRDDGRWYFLSRVVRFEFRDIHPFKGDPEKLPEVDDTYTALSSRLFAKGARP